MKMGLFAPKLERSWSISTDTRENGRYIIEEIVDSILFQLSEYNAEIRNLKGIGIGVPGPVSDSRIVHGCVNIGWETVDLKEEMQNELALKTGMDPEDFRIAAANDANAAALGEMWLGAGKRYKNLVFVTLGTGVGGGMIVNGNILNGSVGAAGEIGHIYCGCEEWIEGCCSCGSCGCLEQIASAGGIVHVAEKLVRQEEKTSILKEVWKERGQLTAKDILDAGRAGDSLADDAVEIVSMYLGRGIASVCAVLNPECVLIGGGVSAAGEYLRAKIERHFRAQAFHVLKDTPIGLAELGNSAGMAGAAKLLL